MGWTENGYDNSNDGNTRDLNSDYGSPEQESVAAAYNAAHAIDGGGNNAGGGTPQHTVTLNNGITATQNPFDGTWSFTDALFDAVPGTPEMEEEAQNRINSSTRITGGTSGTGLMTQVKEAQKDTTYGYTTGLTPQEKSELDKALARKDRVVSSPDGSLGYWGDGSFTSIKAARGISEKGTLAGDYGKETDLTQTKVGNFLAKKTTEYLNLGFSAVDARKMADADLGQAFTPSGSTYNSQSDYSAFGNKISSGITLTEDDLGALKYQLNIPKKEVVETKDTLPIELAGMTAEEYKTLSDSLTFMDITQTQKSLLLGTSFAPDVLQSLGLTTDEYNKMVASVQIKEKVDVSTAARMTVSLLNAKAKHEELMKTDSFYRGAYNSITLVTNPIKLVDLVVSATTGQKDVFSGLITSLGGTVPTDPYNQLFTTDDKGEVTYNPITGSGLGASSGSPTALANSLANQAAGTGSNTATKGDGPATDAGTGTTTTTTVTDPGATSSVTIPFLQFEKPYGAFYRGDRTGPTYVGAQQLGFMIPDNTTSTTTTTTGTGPTGTPLPTNNTTSVPLNSSPGVTVDLPVPIPNTTSYLPSGTSGTGTGTTATPTSTPSTTTSWSVVGGDVGGGSVTQPTPKVEVSTPATVVPSTPATTTGTSSSTASPGLMSPPVGAVAVGGATLDMLKTIYGPGVTAEYRGGDKGQVYVNTGYGTAVLETGAPLVQRATAAQAKKK